MKNIESNDSTKSAIIEPVELNVDTGLLSSFNISEDPTEPETSNTDLLNILNDSDDDSKPSSS